MATAAKPGAAPAGAKQAAADATDAPPPKKSKKKLIIIIAIVLLLAGGGGAAFFLMKPAQPDNPGEVTDEVTGQVTGDGQKPLPPKYVELGTFTANLIHEEGDRYLQVAISLKLRRPDMEEQIRANTPEIQHRLNMLLQSKRPSELATIEGREKLAADVKAQVEYVMGFRKTAPVITTEAPISDTEAPVTDSGQPDATQEASGQITQSSPVAASAVASKNDIADVLFTSFLVQ